MQLKIKSQGVILFLFWFRISSFGTCSKPIFFSQRYTANPGVIVYGGRIYVYASHDV